jgi:hypothetical protein
MDSRWPKILAALCATCLAVVIAFAAYKWRSYNEDYRASIELSKLGGTHTLRSAARLRDTGSRPTFLDELKITNPITEVDLSMTSWPRENATFPPVTDKDIGVIECLKHLERLSLRGMPITDAAIHQLERFRYLKYLDVRETQISEQGLSSLKEALPSCEVVADHKG